MQAALEARLQLSGREVAAEHVVISQPRRERMEAPRGDRRCAPAANAEALFRRLAKGLTCQGKQLGMHAGRHCSQGGRPGDASALACNLP
jgi:hypothetical protein